jgi:Wzt C-terminal domain
VRLGFASAIQADAEIFLVDEVLAVGDARFQQKCFDTFREFKREGRTVIYVTHDLDTIERFCDRAMWLEGGNVEAVGAPQDVIRAYRQRDIEMAQASRHTRTQTAARWGDGAAEIVEAWIEDSDGHRQDVLSQGETVIFKARARFSEAMEDPILGVTFKSEDGRAVFITNTLFDRVVTGIFEPGDEAVYALRFALHFGDGEHTASPAIAHDDTRMADWREGLVTFRVQGERHTGGSVDLPHEADVTPEPSAQRSSAIRGSARR